MQHRIESLFVNPEKQHKRRFLPPGVYQAKRAVVVDLFDVIVRYYILFACCIRGLPKFSVANVRASNGTPLEGVYSYSYVEVKPRETKRNQ